MIPVSLDLLNFLPYRDPGPLNFSGIHVACLAGENGAGKSSLLDAITWALWGKARDGKRSDDELIHHGENEMRVEFVFDLGGDRYKVIRQRKAGKRGQSILEFQTFDVGTESWRSLSEAGIRATQNRINDLLRIDYETFVNSAFILQGRADAFTVKPPGERKAVLGNILGLDRWNKYEARARDRISALREEILVLDREIEILEAELEKRGDYERELAAAKRQLETLGAQLQTAERAMADVQQARQALATTRKQIDDLTKRIAQDGRELAEVERELTDARAALARGDPATLAAEQAAVDARLTELGQKEAEQVTLAKERSQAAERSARLQGENTSMQAESDPLKQRIAVLEAATEPICPTCGQPLAEHARDQLVTDLRADLDARRTRWAENKAAHKELDQQVAAFDAQLAALAAELKERALLQRKLVDLKAAFTSAGEAQAKIGALEARQKRWSASIAADQKQLETLEADARGYELQVQAADTRQAALEKLRWEHRVATEHVGSARQKLSALDGVSKRRDRKRTQRQELAAEQGMFEELRAAFGKQGVPAMIIEAAVPEIEEIANSLLNRMTDGRMHVRFETQRETKTGDVRETLDINISDELGTRAYELFSGGESFRVNFAIRIALSKLLARRAGAQLQTIIIDEGFGTQDARGRERLVAAINAIQDDFERILVITHIEELKDAFPTRINVVKAPDGAQFSIE